MTPPRPNFFIVGAPRCGTTAMYEYLRAHPEIFMPPNDKEPHYFGSDLTGPRFERLRGSEAKYLRLFADAGSAAHIGEGSVLYLYSRRAAREIHQFNPQSRIIIMLRSPIEMLHSFHSLLVSLGDENLTDFRAALAAEADRRAGKRLPNKVYLGREVLYYRDLARYSEQVQRYFEVFGREAVRVIIFDDFRQDTAASYRQTLQFLGADPGFQTDFSPRHGNMDTRSKLLLRILRSRRLVQIGSRIQPVVMPIYTRLRAWNTVPAQRQPLDPDLAAQLAEEFRPEVEALSRLLDRDLTHWCQPQDSR